MKLTSALAPTLPLNDDAIVPEELIGRLLHASERAIFNLMDDFTPDQRANLAMFCYRKTHLRQIGLAIAATCDLPILIQEWGTALGRALFTQSRERSAESDGISGQRRPKITLANSAGTVVAPMIDLDD